MQDNQVPLYQKVHVELMEHMQNLLQKYRSEEKLLARLKIQDLKKL